MDKNFLLLFILLLSATMNAQVILPDSSHVSGRNHEYFESTWEASHKAIGGNIFLGQGFLQGNFSDNFTSPFFVGISIDIHRRGLVFQIDDYIGFGKTRQLLTFKDAKRWESNKGAYHFLLGGNIGYKVLDNKHLMWVPLMGIGGNILTSTVLSSSDNSHNEPFLPYYKLGFFMDFKSLTLLQKHIRINDADHNYTSLRLSVGYNFALGQPKYPEFYQGSMFYITLGMGGLSRNFNRSSKKKI